MKDEKEEGRTGRASLHDTTWETVSKKSTKLRSMSSHASQISGTTSHSFFKKYKSAMKE